ncbi:Mdm33 family-domain-containing protein [Durotheca rogersii]|uniref:Mdm33 family-domain-containing protein n=1 Tax=Durotheca rogersii TaxID=419775 RepID=UPI00221F50AF|nr:Mdm33 family-domain-containing protein [Durotheca rogersii]KAI5868699.1 Mdm33 family-domain-containing protein [Durotheca rogersii]
MSTSRVLRPLFGPSRRFLVDQLVPPQVAAAGGACRLISNQPPTAPVCLTCRHRLVANPHQRLHFSSSRTTSSFPSKPASSRDSDSNQGPTTTTPDTGNDSSSNLFAPPIPPLSSSSSTPPPYPASSESEPPNPTEPPLPPPPPQGRDGSSRSSSDDSDSHADRRQQHDPELPSALNSRRSQLNRSLSAFMDRAQTTFFVASRRLNDLTGYSGIETLKGRVSALEAALAAAQRALHEARSAYKGAVAGRSATQREVTTLLARQKTWSPADFERFTALYRQDYELDADVARRAAALEDAERDAERLARDLSAAILSRYHEEQIWSDKIRRMSTWGTWGLMGVNVLLFLVFQFGAEPWRRRRLVRGFEAKVREALDEDRDRVLVALAEVHGPAAAAAAARTGDAAATAPPPPTPPRTEPSQTPGQDELAGTSVPPALAELAGKPSTPPAVETEPAAGPLQITYWRDASWREALLSRDWWRAVAADLWSERQVAVRMRDVSVIAMEGAAAGAALAGTTAALVFLVVARRT